MNFFFYFFLILIIFVSFLVILSNNPVQSVLFLILVYLFTASFFMLLGTEFLAILIFIIYIGAISILFLFVIMLLNLRTIELYNTFFNYLPIGSFIGLLFFLEIFYLFSFDFPLAEEVYFFDSDVFNFWIELSRLKANLFLFGELLYDEFWFLVIAVAIILLISMIGSIILTIDDNLKISKEKRMKSYLTSSIKISNISFWKKKFK